MGLFTNLLRTFQKDKYQEDNYLSLVLTSDRVVALIWTFDQGQVRQLGFGQKIFTNTDILLHQTAVAIDTAQEEAKVDFEKTVFGLSSYWLEDGQISQKSIKIIKKLSDELELNPQAFVPLAVGVIHLFKIEKIPSPQVVAIGIFAANKKAFCEVHLIDGDKVVKTKTTELAPTVDKIQRLVEELRDEDNQLPASIVIFGIDQNDQLAQKITKIDWGQLFPHVPKLDFLDDKSLALSVAYAQAADLLGHEPITLEQKPAAILKQKEQAIVANELGFIEGEDILLTKPQNQENTEDEPASPVVHPGHEQRQASLEIAPEPSEINQTYAVEVKDQTQEVEIEKTSPKLPFVLKFLNLIRIPKDPKKVAIAILILIFLALFSSFAAGQFLTRAEIVIKVNSRQHQASFTTTVPNQIPGETIKGATPGSQKTPTTGSKKIGDPARGEVSIINWVTSPKTFTAQTAIITQNGLKFTLDEDVQVASRSASTPGKNKVGATAQEVGPNSNLSQGTEFTFVQFDEISYSAQAETAFTGGAERQVTTVTAQDLDRLEKSLIETVTARARDDLKNKAAGKLLLDSAINMKITRKNFDKKEGEEASLLTLDMEIQAESFVFDENDLKKILAENTNNSIDPTLQARPENIQILEIKAKREPDSLTISGDFRANLVPRFNEEELAKQIAAKSPKEVRGIIKQTPQVADVAINYSPNIPFITSVPRDPKKIMFKIETN